MVSKMLGRIAVAVGGAALLWSGGMARAQVTPANGKYLFRVKYTPGKTVRYTMQMDIGGDLLPQKSLTQKMEYTLTCTQVEEGIATVRANIGPTAAGGSVNQEKSEMMLTIDPRGKALWGEMPLNRFGITFPERMLKPGDVFQSGQIVSLPMFGAKNQMDIFRFVGVKTVDGKQVAELAVQTKAEKDGIQFEANGTLLLDPVNGQLTRMDYTNKMRMKRGEKIQEMTVKALLTRVP